MSQLAGPYIIEDRMLASGKRSVRVRFKLGKIKFDARGSTLAEATMKAAAAAKRGAPSRVALAESRKHTVATWIEHYMETYGTDYSINTKRAYEGQIRLYILPAIGSVLLRNLSVIEVEKTVLDAASKAPAAGIMVYGLLNKMLEKAYKMEIIPRNPMDIVEKPKIKRKKKVAASPEQLNAVVEAMRGHFFEDHIVVMIETGMRIGEVVGLTRGDVDQQRGVLHVRQQIGNDVGSLPMPLKTETSLRDVHVSAALMERLVARLASWPELGPGDPLFPSKYGRWQHSGPLGATVIRLGRRLKLNGLRLHAHAFRHAHISSLLQVGAPLTEISKRVGHASTQTTHLYAHAIEGGQVALAELMSTMLRGAAATQTKPDSDDWLR